MVDPIAGWRVASDEYEIHDNLIYKRRRRGNVSTYAFAAMVIAMPVAAVAAVLLW